MSNEYPDPADRILAYAYGDQLSEDADNILDGASHLDAAQQCYDTAYTQLVADFEAGEVKKSAAKNMHTEIRKGMLEVNAVLTDSQQVMENNLQNYNEALTAETSSMGFNLSDLAQAATLARGVAGSAGVGGAAGGCDMLTAARCQRIAAAQQMQATGGWGVNMNTRPDIVAAANASYAQSMSAPGNAAYAKYGAMNNLSALGGLASVGAISPTAAAAVGGQALLGAAVGGSNTAQDAAVETAPAAPAVPEPVVSEAMMNSLRATGVSSEKFMEAYGQIALTTANQYTVAERVGEKAGW